MSSVSGGAKDGEVSSYSGGGSHNFSLQPGQSVGDSGEFHEGDEPGEDLPAVVVPGGLDQEGTPKTGDIISFYSEKRIWIEAHITGTQTGTQHYYNCQRTDNNKKFGLYLIPSHLTSTGRPESWTFVRRK